MNKKFLVPVLAAAVIGGGVAGSLLNNSAFAANSNSNNKVEVSDQQEQKQLEKEEKEDKDGEVSDKQEQQQLEKEAKFSAKESATIALKEVKGQVTDTELEDEDGQVVYGIEITDDQGKKHDVKVDAKTGKVLKDEVDDENDSESEQE